mgnify:FL=1
MKIIKIKKHKEFTKEKKRKIEISDIFIFLIIFVIFGISLLSFFPGLVTSDVVDQISQAENNEYKNAHPILHSFIIGNLAKLVGDWGPALFQIIVFAFIWTYCCKCIRKYNNSISNKIFQIIFTFIIAVLPLNFLYSITLWKDILYSYSFLLLLAIIYIGIKNNFNYTIGQTIILAISCVSIMRLRHNGFPIGLIMFGLILILNIVNTKQIKSAIKLIIPFIMTFIIMSIPQWTLNSTTNEAQVGGALDSTKIYCMGALLNSDIEFEKEDIEFLNKIIDTNKWKEKYSAYDGTPILFSNDYNRDILKSSENKSRFNELFNKYASKKPEIIINHFLNINSIWWKIKEPEKSVMHSIIINNGSVSEISNGRYDNKPILKQWNEKLSNYAIKTLEHRKIYTVIYRPAVAILVAVISIIIVCLKEKKKMYLLILLPMLLNIGTYVFLISSQDQRYFYPCFMTEYISVLMLANCIIKNKKSEKKKNDIELNKENPKTLIIIPAYNEEESIKKVINSVYEQNIKNCDVLVVNDGSNDNTYKEAKKTNAIVIDSPNNLGIGGAVQTGYLYAKKYNYDIAIQLDGDGQHDPKYIQNLINEILKGNDLVIGSRFVKKTDYKQTFFRMFGINIISSIIKLMTHVKIYDTTSGYRAANKNVIEEFVENYPYDYPEPCTNMYMIKKGYKVNEIPVKMKKRETGVSSISPLKSISYMFKVILYIFLMGIKD